MNMEKLEYYCDMCGEKLEEKPKIYYKLITVFSSFEENRTISNADRIDICGKCEPEFMKFLTREKCKNAK